MLKLPVTEIAKLKVGPGDVVVVKSAKTLSPPQQETLAAQLRAILPGTEIVILDEGVSLEVVTAAGTNPPSAATVKKTAAKRAPAKKTAKP